MIQRRKVTDDGQVTDLGDYVGAEVFVVKTPTGMSPDQSEKVAKALEKPLAALEDVRRFVTEHRDLMRRQVDEFTARYGNPAEKARAYAKNLNPDEFRAKVNEVNALVEKRLETISQDLERRYDDLEREVESAIERVFGGRVRKSEDEAPRDVQVEPVESESANGATPAAEKASSGKSD